METAEFPCAFLVNNVTLLYPKKSFLKFVFKDLSHFEDILFPYRISNSTDHGKAFPSSGEPLSDVGRSFVQSLSPLLLIFSIKCQCCQSLADRTGDPGNCACSTTYEQEKKVKTLSLRKKFNS